MVGILSLGPKIQSNCNNFFYFQHPGGFDILLDYVGYDGTLAFRGTGHSKAALKMMESYLIGILPESQRLYTNKMKW